MLTQADIDRYREEGLVIPNYRLPAETLARMRSALAEFLPEDPSLTPDFVPNLMDSGFGVEFGSIPEILDMVGALIGNDIVLWASGMFGKPALQGKETAWHQDGQYWPIRPLATCTVWVALDDSTTENGCLRYIAGSHAPGTIWGHARSSSQEIVLNQVLPAEHCDESRARDVVLEAGQISIHDVHLIHGSRVNHSGKRRAGVTFRYMPTTSHYDHALAAERHRTLGVPDISRRVLHLVRGIDVCGRNDFSVGRDAPVRLPA